MNDKSDGTWEVPRNMLFDLAVAAVANGSHRTLEGALRWAAFELRGSGPGTAQIVLALGNASTKEHGVSAERELVLRPSDDAEVWLVTARPTHR